MGRCERILFLCLVLVAASSRNASAQTENPDDLFRRAQKLSLAGNRQEAKALCQAILRQDSNYIDARILLGRLYAWEGAYDSAREQLSQVLAAFPDYADAREALIDVELWSKHPREALRFADAGLVSEPGNKSFLQKKARALEMLKDAARPYRARIEYSTDIFDKTFQPWRLTSISLSREQAWGTIIGRANLASRFDQTAAQMEIDAYPKLKNGMYAHLNLGYSPSAIFPRLRSGAELYQSLPRSFEASLGFRRLSFGRQRVMVYTGSVSKYFGDYWVSFRPTMIPGALGRSFSGTVTLRRYFGEGDSFLALGLGAGSSPDERYATAELIRLRSRKISVEGRKKMRPGWHGIGALGFENQGLPAGGTRHHLSLSFGVERSF